jgi:hypothetical protein
MTNIARMRMHSSTHGTHPLQLHGAAPIAVVAGFALVPYPHVRQAMANGWDMDPSDAWPPRRGAMSPPQPLAPATFSKFDAAGVAAMCAGPADRLTYRELGKKVDCNISTTHQVVNGKGAFYGRVGSN